MELSTRPSTLGSPPSPESIASFSGRTTAWQRSPGLKPSTSVLTWTPLSSSTSPCAPVLRTVPGIRLETPMKPATNVVVGRS